MSKSAKPADSAMGGWMVEHTAPPAGQPPYPPVLISPPPLVVPYPSYYTPAINKGIHRGTLI